MADKMFLDLAKLIGSPEIKNPLIALAAEIDGNVRAEKQALSITNAILALQDQVHFLKRDNDRMQTIIDRSLEALLSHLRMSITDYTSAQEATETYGIVWFAKQLYSMQALQKIAMTLLIAVEPYKIPNKFWESITEGDFSSIDTAFPDEHRKPVKKSVLQAYNG